MAVGYLAFFLFPMLLICPLLICALFVYPFSRAFIAGVESARDPGHQLTPQSPWYFFDPYCRKVYERLLQRELRIVGIVFAILSAVVALYSGSWMGGIYFFAIAGPATLSWFFTAITVVFFLSPRFTSPVVLTCVGLLAGTISIFLLVALLLAGSFGGAEFALFAAPSITALFSFILFSSVWHGIRNAQSRTWFGLEA